MGEKIIGKHDAVIKPVETTGTGATGRSTESESSRDSRTTDRGTGGTGRPGGTGTGTGETEKKIVPGLVDVVPDKNEERNAKRRERYAKQKAENGETVKPRKVNKKKTKEPEINTTQLNIVIATVSSVIASRPGCEHWLLNETEINSITTPLSKMIAESETFANVGQYSNQIALVMACFTVFMPRLIVTATKKKEEKKIVKSVTRPAKPVDGNKVTDIKPDRRNDEQPTTNGKNNDSNVSFFGSALC